MEIGPFDDIVVGKSHVQWLHHFGDSDRWGTMDGLVLPPDKW
jgi:hypothetical protein